MKPEKLKTRGFYVILLKIPGAALSVLISVVLARSLGIENYGVYAYVLSVLTILVLPAEAGLPQLVTRITAQSLVKEDYAALLGIWRWAAKVVLYVGLVVILVISVYLLIDNTLENKEKEAFIAGLLLPIFIAINHVRAASLRGLKLVVQAMLLDVVLKNVILLIYLLFMLWCFTSIDPAEAIMGHTAALITTVAIGLWLMARHADKIKELAPGPRYEKRNWMSALIPLSLVSGLRQVNIHAPLLLLGMLSGKTDVGAYKAISVLTASLALPLQALNGMVSPYLAQHYVLQQSKKIERLTMRVTLASFLMTAIPTIVLIIWGKPIIKYAYGVEYTVGYSALVILLIAQLVNVAIGPVALLLNMSGNERLVMRGVGVSSLVNVVTCLILIPSYGLTGAAVAASISIILWNLILYYLVKSRLGVDGSIAGLLTFLWRSK